MSYRQPSAGSRVSGQQSGLEHNRRQLIIAGRNDECVVCASNTSALAWRSGNRAWFRWCYTLVNGVF